MLSSSCTQGSWAPENRKSRPRFWAFQGWRQNLRVTLLSSSRGLPKGLRRLWETHLCLYAFTCDTDMVFDFLNKKPLILPPTILLKFLLLWSLKLSPWESQPRVESSNVVGIFKTWKLTWFLICVELGLSCVRFCVCVCLLSLYVHKVYMHKRYLCNSICIFGVILYVSECRSKHFWMHMYLQKGSIQYQP